MKKSFIKDALILFLITIIAGVALGGVYAVTKDPIAQAEYNKQQNAYREVMKDAVEFKELPGFDQAAASKVLADASLGDDNVVEGVVQAVDSSGSLLGYVISVTNSAGYGGNITFSVGYKTDGTVTGYSLTTINETAGLGMKAKEDPFKSQYNDKKVDSFEVTKSAAASDNQIEAISGATITSRAVTGGMNAAIAYGAYLMTETGGELINE